MTAPRDELSGRAHRCKSLAVMLGPPGSGKGTQGTRVAALAGLEHISIGDVFRDEVCRGSRLGQRVRPHLEAGALVPDALVVECVRMALDRHDDDVPMLLDGFPRTRSQAAALDHLGSRRISLAIALVVPRAVLLQRLVARGRPDDRADVVRRRMLSYETETRPLLRWYAERGLLVHVDGNRAPADVTATLVGHLLPLGGPAVPV